MQFDKETKQRFLEILKKTDNPETLPNIDMGDVAMLFYFQKHMFEAQFNFVPKKYKLGFSPAKKKGKK